MTEQAQVYGLDGTFTTVELDDIVAAAIERGTPVQTLIREAVLADLVR